MTTLGPHDIPDWLVVTTSDTDPYLVSGEDYDFFQDKVVADGYCVIDIHRDEIYLTGTVPTYTKALLWSLTRDLFFDNLAGRTITPAEFTNVFPKEDRVLIIEAFDPNNLIHVMIEHEEN